MLISPMNQHDGLSGAIGMLIGLAFCIASISLGLGEVHQPGPGFLPFIVGAVLLSLSVVIFVPTLRKGKALHPEKINRGIGKHRKGGLILLALVFYNLGLNFLGFSVTTFLFVVFLMKNVEAQRWTRTVVTALCSAVGFYFVFQAWLRLDLPTGPWGF
ncbi:MAG: tripartite tricarboxylate transporter TctB family protein [Thermodesulfobacteriota bacterium]